MSAIAHGMKPHGDGPSVSVAKEFLRADEREGKFERPRHPHSEKAWTSSVPLHREHGGPVSFVHEVQQAKADSLSVKPRHVSII